jgi:large subunit ribosomal protein L10
MTKEEKTQVISELADKFANVNYFYVTDSSGMTVAQVNKFRRMCFEKGIEYKVVKNTLIEKALSKSNLVDYSPFSSQVLKGTSGIMFSPESGKVPAEVLKSFRKGAAIKLPVLKGASIDGGFFYGDESIDILTNLKSKNELIGDTIGLLQSPAKNVISALMSGGNKIAGIVKTLSERTQ